MRINESNFNNEILIEIEGNSEGREKNTYSSHRDENFHKQTSKCMFYIFIFYFQEVLSTFLSKEALEKYSEKRRQMPLCLCLYAIKTTSSITLIASLNLKPAICLLVLHSFTLSTLQNIRNLKTCFPSNYKEIERRTFVIPDSYLLSTLNIESTQNIKEYKYAQFSSDYYEVLKNKHLSLLKLLENSILVFIYSFSFSR